LDSLGYSYLVEDRVMQIAKDALVVMNGEKIGNLYKLLENTITGGAAASTSAEPDSVILFCGIYGLTI
jgi:hypothetical protein